MDEMSPAPAPPAPEFWRRTPPALFPALFGLLGLGLAWRAGAAAFPGIVPAVFGESILGVAGLIYLFCLSSYVSKLSVRPSVLFEDIMSPPGRAGAATLTLSLFLFCTALVPYAPLVAGILLWLAVVLHLAMAISAVLVMSQQDLGLKVTPAWHLSFVGFILASVAAVPLGFQVLALFIFAVTVLLGTVIYGVSLLQMTQGALPPPQRPLLAIHLAPVSLFATVSALLGAPVLSYIFVVLAVGLGAVLLSRAGHLTEAGFSPLWGAFTFPIAALANALFTTAQFAPGLAWIGLVPLILATLITPVVAVRILLMWVSGVLAERTGAAVA